MKNLNDWYSDDKMDYAVLNEPSRYWLARIGVEKRRLSVVEASKRFHIRANAISSLFGRFDFFDGFLLWVFNSEYIFQRAITDELNRELEGSDEFVNKNKLKN